MKNTQGHAFNIYIDLFDDGSKHECVVLPGGDDNYLITCDGVELCSLMHDPISGLWVVTNGNLEKGVVDDITLEIQDFHNTE